MSEFKYGTLQLARLLALAEAHGHWWTAAFLPGVAYKIGGHIISEEVAFTVSHPVHPGDNPDMERVELPGPSPTRPEGWTPKQITEEADMRGSDWVGVCAPEPNEQGQCSHTTGTGRLSWHVSPDGTSTIVATRAHPKVQALRATWLAAVDEHEVAWERLSAARTALWGDPYWTGPGDPPWNAELAKLAATQLAAELVKNDAGAHLNTAQEENLPPVEVLRATVNPNGRVTFLAPKGVAAVSQGAASAFVNALGVINPAAVDTLPTWLQALAAWEYNEDGTRPPPPEAYTRALSTDPSAPITPPPPPPKALAVKAPVRQL